MQKNSPYDIVKHLMMTEKSALLKEENKYAFKYCYWGRPL